jgi:uncharacterized membrane protein YbhN (UPF0104 family)
MAGHPAADGDEQPRHTFLRGWLRPLLQLFSLLLFAGLLWYGGAETWRQILESDYRLMLVAFLWLGVVTMVSAYRLQVVAEAVAGDGGGVGWSRYFYVNVTARALGLVLPRGVSILGGKTVGLRALGIPMGRAVVIVLLDNLLDVALLAALVGPGLLYLRGNVSAWGFWLLSAAIVVVLGGLMWWGAAQGRWQRPLGWLRRWPRLAAVLPVEAAWEAGERLTRPAVLRAYGLTVVLNWLLGVQYYWIAAAIRWPQPAALFLAAFPLTQLSLIVAIAPGGLGIFDLSWYGLLLLGGAAETAATTFVIAQRAAIFVFILLWAGISALLVGSRRGENPKSQIPNPKSD